MRYSTPLILFLTLLFIVPTLGAQDDKDKSKIKEVITSQLEAFNNDQAGDAYSFAAPSIQNIFKDSDEFLTMVRKEYAPVYRSKNHIFGKLMDSPHGWIQIVYITDQSNVGFKAYYFMQKQQSGEWLINGCVLEKAETV